MSVPGRFSLEGAEVLVIGASSQVGWFLVPRLVAVGAQVLALSRSGQPDGFPDFKGVQWIGPEQAHQRQDSISHLVSAGPLPLALEYARKLTALRGLCATSSSSVLTKSASPNAAERSVITAISRAEQELQQLALQRELPLLILRPTLLYGAGMDRNISVLAALIRRFGILPIASRAGGMRQPLHVDDLAEALLRGLLEMPGKLANQSLTGVLGGGETLDYRAMVRRVFQALDRPPRFLSINPKLLATALDVAARLGLARGANGEMVRRQSINLVFDDREVRNALDLSPRRFSPRAEDFMKPDSERLQRLSRRV